MVCKVILWLSFVFYKKKTDIYIYIYIIHPNVYGEKNLETGSCVVKVFEALLPAAESIYQCSRPWLTSPV